TLLTTDISHFEILLGKTLTSTFMGVLSSISLLAGLSLISHFTPEITGGISLIKKIGFTNLLLMSLMIVFSTLLFSSLAIVAGLYAKTVKEGNLIILPVIILTSVISGAFNSIDLLGTNIM